MSIRVQCTDPVSGQLELLTSSNTAAANDIIVNVLLWAYENTSRGMTVAACSTSAADSTLARSQARLTTPTYQNVGWPIDLPDVNRVRSESRTGGGRACWRSDNRLGRGIRDGKMLSCQRTRQVRFTCQFGEKPTDSHAPLSPMSLATRPMRAWRIELPGWKYRRQTTPEPHPSAWHDPQRARTAP